MFLHISAWNDCEMCTFLFSIYLRLTTTSEAVPGGGETEVDIMELSELTEKVALDGLKDEVIPGVCLDNDLP